MPRIDDLEDLFDSEMNVVEVVYQEPEPEPLPQAGPLPQPEQQARWAYDPEAVFDAATEINTRNQTHGVARPRHLEILRDFGIEFLGMTDPVVFKSNTVVGNNRGDYDNRWVKFVLHENSMNVSDWLVRHCEEFYNTSGHALSIANNFHNQNMDINRRQPWLYDDYLESEDRTNVNTYKNISINVFGKNFHANSFKTGLSKLKDIAKEVPMLSKSQFCNQREENIYVVVIEKIIDQYGHPSPRLTMTNITNWRNGHDEVVNIVLPMRGTLNDDAYLPIDSRGSYFSMSNMNLNNSTVADMAMKLRSKYRNGIRRIIKQLEYEELLSKIDKLEKTKAEKAKAFIQEMLPSRKCDVLAQVLKDKPTQFCIPEAIFYKPDKSKLYWYMLTRDNNVKLERRESQILRLTRKEQACSTKTYKRLIQMMTEYSFSKVDKEIRPLRKEADKLRSELSAPKFNARKWEEAGFEIITENDEYVEMTYTFNGYTFMDVFFVPVIVKEHIKYKFAEGMFAKWMAEAPQLGGFVPFHPHVADTGKVCAGTFGDSIKAAFQSNSPNNLIAQMALHLNNYNQGTQYRPITRCTASVTYMRNDERGNPKAWSKQEVQDYYRDHYANSVKFLARNPSNQQMELQNPAGGRQREPEQPSDSEAA